MPILVPVTQALTIMEDRLAQKANVLMAVLLCCQLFSKSAQAGLSAYFGTWVGDGGPWNGYVFRMTDTHVDIGPGECRNLKYKIIEVYPSDKDNNYMSIEIIGDRP